MDIQAYYKDVRKLEKKYEEEVAPKHGGVVYVTSRYHREKNSVEGRTLSATPWNAARVVTDDTHRLATEDEIKAFLAHQETERVKHTKMEQTRQKQYIVLVDQAQPGEAAVLQGAANQKSAVKT